MNTNPGLDKKARRNMYKMYEIGISVAEIANKFSMSYSLPLLFKEERPDMHSKEIQKKRE
jgi:hypothetical protein